MRTTIPTVSLVIAFGCCILTSCDTPVGQGAAWGAATGAIIGGAATGHVRAASIGAAAGGGCRGVNGCDYSGKSSCALWATAARWLSIRPLGGNARFLLQSLHRTGL